MNDFHHESNKYRSSSFPAAYSKILNHPVPCLCGISRLTYFSLLVVITFIICITQEFTFFLKYTSYASTSSTLEYKLPINTSANSSSNHHFIDTQTTVNVLDDWRKASEHIYVYSAFWDTRLINKTFVRVIGGAIISQANLNSTLCLLKYNSSTILKVLAKHEILIEHHSKPSRAIFFQCPATSAESPTDVAVIHMNNNELYKWNETLYSNISWIAVHPLKSDVPPSGIGVCVRPLFNYIDAFKVAEFVAYYEALGVTHFTFYSYEVANDVMQYLNALKRSNYSMDILPWTLPSQLDTMWALGQMASINDCIYRTMNKLVYTTIVDLDEFVTPRYAANLEEVLQMEDITGRKSGSFVFRSCVFCAEYKQDTLPSVILPFKTQNSIHRQNFIYPFLVRSKYVAKSLLVEVAGIHHVWRHIPGWEERFVTARQVLVHHYRSKLCVQNQKTLEKGRIDVKSRKYLNHLMRSKAISVWSKLFINGSIFL